MDTVDILIEGYAHPGKDGSYVASPTTSIIESQGMKILVDPGANKSTLQSALEARQLSTNEISFIYLTHYHPDHFLNLCLFPNTDVYDGTTAWKNDEEYFHEKFIPGTEIEILPTPGHSPEHTSLLVKTEQGNVCIAQDVFWWEDGKQKSDTVDDLLQLEDPFATDADALMKSRKLVLERADWIIPGHGKMFKNPTK